MRKLLLTTAAVAAAIAGAVAGETAFGTFTDTRDGQTYKTVTIGTQTWMAQNLNYQADSSWCYNNADSNCVKYGRLYAWHAAQNACPAGYHLPSRKEWGSLVATAGGKEAGTTLKARSGWKDNGNGTDDYGFSALPSGYRFSYRRTFYYVGDFGGWWTAAPSDHPYLWFMHYSKDFVYEDYSFMIDGFSVRCVADTP